MSKVARTKLILPLTIIVVILLATLGISGCNKLFLDTPEEVWGDLERHDGGGVWDTLTIEQQALVNYPEFNEDNQSMPP